jgi:hypothetical protein
MTGYGGYHILPGEDYQRIVEKGDDFLGQYNDKINQAIETFGSYSARELELRSTIIFCLRDMMSLKNRLNIDDLVSTVSEIKPRFSHAEIRQAIDELKHQGVISEG